MEFSIYQIPPFITGLASLVLGSFVLTRKRTSDVHRSFFMLSVSIAIWQFGAAFRWALVEDFDSIFWGKILYIGVTFIPATYYHFTAEFNQLPQRRRLIPFMYALSTALLLFLLQDDFIVGVKPHMWGKQLQVGGLHPVYLFFWVIPLLAGYGNSWRGYRDAKPGFERRRRRFLLVVHTLTGLAVIDFLPNYGIALPYSPGFVFFLFFIGATTYAILRYQLLDITVLVKRLSFVTFLAITAAVFLYVASLYLQPHLIKMYGRYWVFFPVSISFLIGLSIFRLVGVIREMEEKELERKYSYRPLLRRAAERFSQVRTVDELLSFTTRDVSSWVKLDYVGIMVWDPAQKEFVLRRSLTRSARRTPIKRGITLGADDPLVLESIRRRYPLVRDEIAYRLETDKKIAAQEYEFLNKVLLSMHRVGADEVVPCFCEETLLVLVTLGKKVAHASALTREELELFASLSGQVGRTMHGLLLKKEKIQLIVASQNILISAIEAKDTYTRGHTDRVANLADMIGQQMEKQVRHYPSGRENLKWAAQLHDIGKIGIPDAILFKPGPLDEKEWKIIREHPVNGLNILGQMREWLSEDICSGILHHHENYDGSGYPARQRGEEIHLFARIIRVADAFDSMSTSRPYREAMIREDAVSQLIDCRGTQFDPVVVDALLELCAAGRI